MKLGIRIPVFLAVSAVFLVQTAISENEKAEPILPELSTSSERTVSTVPLNGDVNPYGVAFVPEGFPESESLAAGDILVSNFNNSQNQQGTGTTIVRVKPTGEVSLFFQGKTGLGLTTALGVLRSGFVLVGNVPTTDGASATVQTGSLLILNRSGSVAANLMNSTLLDGPWDLTIHDEGGRAQVYVSNVLSGTVTRLDLSIAGEDGAARSIQVTAATQIASGYVHRTDPNALVIGPTGLAYDQGHDVLFVAATGNNTIFAIDHARLANHDQGVGRVVYQDNAHLHEPLGLALAPNGNLITANGDAVNPGGTQNALVEFNTDGHFIAQFQLDMGAGGGAFGLAFGRAADRMQFAAVDDDQNTLNIWTLR